MAFIEIEGLKKIYGSHEVLKGIDLSVERHQVVSLIGASGSGKSTLLRCINALETIDGGQISIDIIQHALLGREGWSTGWAGCN